MLKIGRKPLKTVFNDVKNGMKTPDVVLISAKNGMMWFLLCVFLEVR